MERRIISSLQNCLVVYNTGMSCQKEQRLAVLINSLLGEGNVWKEYGFANITWKFQEMDQNLELPCY